MIFRKNIGALKVLRGMNDKAEMKVIFKWNHDISLKFEQNITTGLFAKFHHWFMSRWYNLFYFTSFLLQISLELNIRKYLFDFINQVKILHILVHH